MTPSPKPAAPAAPAGGAGGGKNQTATTTGTVIFHSTYYGNNEAKLSQICWLLYLLRLVLRPPTIAAWAQKGVIIQV